MGPAVPACWTNEWWTETSHAWPANRCVDEGTGRWRAGGWQTIEERSPFDQIIVRDRRSFLPERH